MNNNKDPKDFVYSFDVNTQQKNYYAALDKINQEEKESGGSNSDYREKRLKELGFK
jgi:hypothetical protein